MADRNVDRMTLDEAEQEVALAREAFRTSVEAARRRLDPAPFIRDARTFLAGDGRSLAMATLRKARANPVPLVLITIGLVWLTLGVRRQAEIGVQQRDQPVKRRRRARVYDIPVASDLRPSSVAATEPNSMRPVEEHRSRTEPPVAARTADRKMTPTKAEKPMASASSDVEPRATSSEPADPYDPLRMSHSLYQRKPKRGFNSSV
ncbi:hypothetical protein [uncultured Jannaschia sp.]|uniref:hypothetical protein n=1 Tax=uncultured Jannaschia sp. TaxID=293347 RepID=UPI002633AAE5|nr:hypothetical protein [uncultured Jannaschia sp.]